MQRPDQSNGREAGLHSEGGGALCVSLEAEIPEVLFEGLRQFLRLHPHWDQYSVVTSALAGFLYQNGCQDRWVTQHYLDGLFQRQEGRVPGPAPL